jgi:hypothetical protein
MLTNGPKDLDEEEDDDFPFDDNLQIDLEEEENEPEAKNGPSNGFGAGFPYCPGDPYW